MTKAAHPVAWGVAMDVPLNESKRFPGMVLRMDTPGAAIWTLLRPQFEKLASISSMVVAPTAITLGTV